MLIPGVVTRRLLLGGKYPWEMRCAFIASGQRDPLACYRALLIGRRAAWVMLAFAALAALLSAILAPVPYAEVLSAASEGASLMLLQAQKLTIVAIVVGGSGLGGLVFLATPLALDNRELISFEKNLEEVIRPLLYRCTDKMVVTDEEAMLLLVQSVLRTADICGAGSPEDRAQREALNRGYDCFRSHGLLVTHPSGYGKFFEQAEQLQEADKRSQESIPQA